LGERVAPPICGVYNNYMYAFGHLNYNPMARTKIVAPEKLLDHVRMMTLASDFIDNTNETGTIKLQVDTPEFRKANAGMLVFLNSANSNYHHNITAVNGMSQKINNAKKAGKLSIDLPIGVVDANDPENKFLCNYYKVSQFPTIVFQSYDGNYHQFNGTKGLTSAIKKYCEGLGGECNVLDFGENNFLDGADLNGALVNVNLSS
jgi:hypothetical protein